MLGQRLEIRQGQGLVITPQLQQAIKLLQLSNLELEAFVEAELEKNPLLQREDGDPGEANDATPERIEVADRARREGWRKADQPDPPPVPDDDPEAGEPVDCAALAEDALVRVRRALRLGRAGEAASWMRLHEKLAARLEADREAGRRRERVARSRGAAGAEDPLVSALAPLRDRMAFINGLGTAQVRVGRAWRQGYISDGVYDRLNGLNSAAVGVLDQLLAAAAPGDPPSSHPDFSAAPDP